MRDESTAVSGSRLVRPLLTRDVVGSAVLHIYLPERSLRMRLEPDRDLVIGRKAELDIPLDDSTVSRVHASLRWSGDALWLEDHDSRNGTYLNSDEVTRSQLRLGDTIEFGSVIVDVRPCGEFEAGHLVGYEEFELLLASEITRARTLTRSMSLAMIRATGISRHLTHWIDAVEAHVRQVDTFASFGMESVLLLLPELGPDAASEVLGAIVAHSAARGAGLVASVVSYPGSGTRPDELIEAAAQLVAPKSGPRVRVGRQQTAVGRTLLVESEAMRTVEELAKTVARSDAAVLIQGETGTGKELVAQLIHQASPRAGRVMKSVNCGALAPGILESTLFGHERGAFSGADEARAGLFEQADGGTLLLDEVGELSPAAQALLLRVLQEGVLVRVGGVREIRVDVRILAATHRDLHALCEEGRFRLDLMFRLNTFLLEVPPLRERPADIEPLARHFLASAGSSHDRRLGLSEAAVERLQGHRWPGNVRELRNAIERAVVVAQGDMVEVGDLPASVSAWSAAPAGEESLPFRERVKRFERELMLGALRACDGNKTAAARRIQMPLRTFMHKCASHGITDPE